MAVIKTDDMRWRVYLFASLALNVLMALGWTLSTRSNWSPSRRMSAGTTTNDAGQIRTNIVVRRQFFTWREVESENYPTYIANLRDINCPEQTIRDIIIADVNALYSRRRATEILTPEQQWWRSAPDSNVVQFAVAKLRELDYERRELLGRLLGPGWEGGDLLNLPRPSRQPIALDGPVLGLLPDNIKQQVEEIGVRSQERIQAYIEAQRAAGKPVNTAELARMRQQTRAELASILSASQLEEFLLRYSQTAITLRTQLGEMKHFNATPDEFRAIFRAADNYEQQVQLLGLSGNDPSTVASRRALEDQRLASIKNMLGPDRFALYQSLQDPGFRDAYASAVAAGAPETAQTLYEINQAAAEETARIRADTNLTAELRAVQLKQAELEQAKAAALAVGQELPPEPPMPPKPPPATVHVLKPGEGLSFLSQHYGVPPAELRAANPNVNFNNLRAGDSVSVPLNLLPSGRVPIQQ